MPDTHIVREPTLDEIKQEVLRRSGKRLQPFSHVHQEDVEKIVARLGSLDRDHWAALWSEMGLSYEKNGDELEKAGDGKKAGEAFYLAYDYCRIGRYPCPSTTGKREAYRHSLRMFRKAAKTFDVPLEVVELPFKGGKLVGYLQIPPGAKSPPVVIHWGGVDGYKEDRQRPNAMLHPMGIATLVIDMPGTGENTVLYLDPDAERTFSAWLDYLATRKDLDGSRLGVWGGSFGGYWAARLAHTEAKRLKAAVFHGGNVHHGFQEKWLVPAFTKGAATYLFGPGSMLEARGQAVGIRTMDEFIKAVGKLSLVDMGLIDKPSAPILCVNGKLDDQAPIDDVYLLMEHGDPKSARIYPKGSHMGRTPGMPEDEIARTITGWLRSRLVP
jgi:dienelactone hydrolase